MKKYIFATIGFAAAVVYVRLSFFTVDAAEYVYVTVLGQHRVTHDGGDPRDGAGLKFGLPWPVQQIQRLDRRLQQFDLRPTDQLTQDLERKTVDKLLSIEAFVCWKISPGQGVDLFVRRIGSADNARRILEPLIISRLGAAIGGIRMDELVTTDDVPEGGGKKVDKTLKDIRDLLLAELKDKVHAEFGIELRDIRLRRFNHPASVRDSIFQRIRAERNKEATRYLSEGDYLASKKTAEAEEEVRKMLAKARSEEEKIKADADIEAMKIRNEAYSLDPEFYGFLKKMEKMQNILGDSKTMLLLSTHRPMFESLFSPPRPKMEAPKK